MCVVCVWLLEFFHLWDFGGVFIIIMYVPCSCSHLTLSAYPHRTAQRFNNCMQMLRCICNILAIFFEQLRLVAEIIRLVAEIVYCMCVRSACVLACLCVCLRACMYRGCR